MNAELWNTRYAEPEYVYGTAPNVFFRHSLQALTPGKLLLPCEGEGRNAVYAASQGWEVQAFDQSEAGRNKALQLAATQQLSLDYQLADVLDFQAEPASYDLIALIYAHFPPSVREVFFARLAGWLKPGGHLLLEAFHPRQLACRSGGPKDPSMLYDEDLLRQDFAALQIQSLETLKIELAEGPLHKGPAEVIRLLAQRPL